jgi:hypothetical protein
VTVFAYALSWLFVALDGPAASAVLASLAWRAGILILFSALPVRAYQRMDR